MTIVIVNYDFLNIKKIRLKMRLLWVQSILDGINSFYFFVLVTRQIAVFSAKIRQKMQYLISLDYLNTKKCKAAFLNKIFLIKMKKYKINYFHIKNIIRR